MVLRDVGIRDEDIGRRLQSFDDGSGDVWDQVESAVDGMFPEDGNLEDVVLSENLRHGGSGEKGKVRVGTRFPCYRFIGRCEARAVEDSS